MTDDELYQLGTNILEAWYERAENYLGFVYDDEKYEASFLESIRRQSYIDFATDVIKMSEDW